MTLPEIELELLSVIRNLDYYIDACRPKPGNERRLNALKHAVGQLRAGASFLRRAANEGE